MWLAQQWEGYDRPEHIWQPVSDIPKYALWPLIVGTLKVVIIAILFAVPLAIGAAIYVSQYAPAAGARGGQAGWSSCWPASPRWCSASSP